MNGVTNLSRIIEEQHVNCDQLAVLSGLTGKAVIDIIDGKRMPTLSEASRLAAALDVSVDELLINKPQDKSLEHDATKVIWETYKKYDTAGTMNMSVAHKLYRYVYRSAMLLSSESSDADRLKYLRHQMYTQQYIVFMEPDIGTINSVPDDVVLELYHHIFDIVK